MCGIVGYIGKQQAAPVILEGLAKLEYRGYDSAGMAVFNGEKIQITKAVGRLKVLEELTHGGETMPGTVGIGHTRWATHGAPSDVNSHPHYNAQETIAVVHNGIIENYLPLKAKLESKGYHFVSDTDTEVVAHLIDYYYKGNPLEAILKVMHRVQGSYALGIMFAEHPEEIFAVRKDSPLIVGQNEEGCFIASDVPAILKYTRKVYFIENHTGVTAKYVIEGLARIPVEVDVASEFRYRNPILEEGTMVIVISQSGETADTLAALRESQKLGHKVLGIVNVVGSSIAREADNVMYTWAGPEIAVATTKAYSAQLIALYLLAMKFAKVRGKLDDASFHDLLEDLKRLPAQIEMLLSNKERIQRFANRYVGAKDVFFIGRGIDYAISMEGSLKLKEISYIHSEAYAAGELKHGTISLIEEGTLVAAVATQDELFQKTLSNMVEVKARGAFVLAVTNEGNTEIEKAADYVIYIPKTNSYFANSLAIIPLQLFGYYVAVGKGCDVDKPRNLAKSVTVE